MIVFTGDELIHPRRPVWPAERPPHQIAVWPERDAVGRIVVFRCDFGVGSVRSMLRLGVAGESPEWAGSWLHDLATAVGSVDR